MTKKLDGKSTKMIMVGYANNLSGDVYRMHNLGTKRDILTRDVKWADWERKNPTDDMGMFSKYENKIPGINELYVATSEVGARPVRKISDEGEYSSTQVSSSEIPVQSPGTPGSVERYRKGRAQTKLRNELRKLRTSYNPTVSPMPGKAEKTWFHRHISRISTRRTVHCHW